MAYTYEQLVQMGATPGTASGTASDSAVPQASPQKKKYTYEELIQLGATPGRAEGAVSEVQQVGQDDFFQKTKIAGTPLVGGLAGKALDFLTASEQRFGETIAGTLIPHTKEMKELAESRAGLSDLQNQVIQRIKEKQARGEDVSRLLGTLKSSGIPSDFDINPALNKTTKQILGEAAGVAVDVLSAGTFGRVAQGIQPVKGFVKGAIEGAKTGAKFGGIFGAAQGGARAAQEEEPIIEGALYGGAGGVIIGGALGGLLGGAGGYLESKAERARQLREYVLQRNDAVSKQMSPPPIPQGITSEDVARFEVDTAGKLSKSKVGKEMVDANINPSYASLIKESDDVNKELFKRQFDVAEKASKDIQYPEKPTNIGGKVILDFVTKLNQKRKNAGADLSKRVSELPSKPIDINKTIEIGKKQVNVFGDFLESLLENGIAVSKKGILDFKNSRYANASAVQGKLQSAFNLVRPDKNGQVLLSPQRIRTVRQTLFTDLNLAKKTNELDDIASALLKRLYDNLDEPLRLLDPMYRKLAQQYAVGTNAIRAFNRLIGKQYQYTDELASTRVGEISLRQLSNASSNVLQILRNIENAGKQLGIKSKVNMRDQALFADFLEDLFNITARTSLQGRVQRGTIQAGEAVQTAGDIVSGNIIGLGRKALSFIKLLPPEREIQIEAVRNALFGGTPLAK